jgi:predicted transcriptional regulator
MPTSNFRLEQLFGSKTRARLLGLFLENSEQSFFVRELTRKIDAQLNSVRRELQNLIELGLVLENRGGAAGRGRALSERKKFYVANTNFLLFHDLRNLFRKIQILLKQNLVQEIKARGDVDLLIFTGRFVDNTNVQTDILIVGSIDQKSLQKVVSEFEAELGYEINYTLMPREEFNYRRQITDRFLFAILEGEKVVMVDKLRVTSPPTVAEKIDPSTTPRAGKINKKP